MAARARRRGSYLPACLAAREAHRQSSPCAPANPLPAAPGPGSGSGRSDSNVTPGPGRGCRASLGRFVGRSTARRRALTGRLPLPISSDECLDSDGCT